MFNPGWVDLQVNGHNGTDYSDPALTAEKFIKSAEELIAAGTEIFLPTIITGPLDKTCRNASLIMEAVDKHDLSKHIPGIHFEGPFISPASGAVGAHDPACVCQPTRENIDKLLNAIPGKVKIITLGADCENAPEAVAYLRQNHVAVSVGHHMADYGQIRRAADAGAQLLTHLGNGCPNMLDRHRNPGYAGLAEERLTAMIITDGHHLPGELVKIFIRAKGTDKIIVTSDASSLTGFPPGEYETLGNRAVLYPDGKLFNPDKQCLVGSASTMSDCMKFLASLDILTADELTRVGRENALELLKSTEKESGTDKHPAEPAAGVLIKNHPQCNGQMVKTLYVRISNGESSSSSLPSGNVSISPSRHSIRSVGHIFTGKGNFISPPEKRPLVSTIRMI